MSKKPYTPPKLETFVRFVPGETCCPACGKIGASVQSVHPAGVIRVRYMRCHECGNNFKAFDEFESLLGKIVEATDRDGATRTGVMVFCSSTRIRIGQNMIERRDIIRLVEVTDFTSVKQSIETEAQTTKNNSEGE